MNSVPDLELPIAEQPGLAAPGSRKALAGFFVSGMLFAYLGAILPAWGHHLLSDYWMVGLYFVALIAGVALAARYAQALLTRKGLGWTLTFACALAAWAILYLAFFSPPFGPWWRMPGLLLMGASTGILHTAIFQAISPMYRHDPAATVNLGGILFGLGCFTVALVVSRAFYVYTAASIQVLLALVPAFFAVGYWRTRFAPYVPVEHPVKHAILAELRNPATVLFSLLLFFQFGNEWAIAGWLPLYLTQRLGISPATSIFQLAMYWLALLVGRVIAQAILPRVRHTRILIGSVLLAMFACTVLLATDNLFGAGSGVLLLGAAFAPIYPLVVERIGNRFPYYHPGLYNGIFSFAMAGGLLAPCTLGYFAWMLGVSMVMALPLAGSLVVFVLLVLIWLETRLNALMKRQRSSATDGPDSLQP
jgi:fucose permease